MLGEKKRKILIVEDDKVVSSMLSILIEEEGHIPEAVFSVKEAREYFKLNLPDILILDLNLPDGSGLEISQFVRKEPGFEEMPIIAFTGDDKFENKKKGFESGIDIYLTKEIDPQEVILWIRMAIRRMKKDFLESHDTAVLGGLKVNCDLHSVEYCGKPVGKDITVRELELLFYLVRYSPRIFSREEIIHKIWKTHSVPNLVDIHLHNLKKKLPKFLAGNIISVPGRGFRYLDNRE